MQAGRLINNVPGVVLVPVAGQDPALGLHSREQACAGVRRLDVKRRGRDAMLDRPIHRPLEHIRTVVIHAEDEAAVDHDAEVVQPLRDGGIVAAEILALVAACQVRRRQRLESDKNASKSGLRGPLDEVAAKNGIHGRGPLKEPTHAAHAVEERACELRVAEKVVVQKVEVAARQPIDLRERVVHALGIEGPAAAEERVLVAEVAVLRTPASHDDRVWNQVPAPLDQVAPDWWNPIQRAA